MNTGPDSMYRALVATGDDPDAPERVRVDHRGDRAVVTLDESDRLNVLSAPLTRQFRRALQALDADADVRTVVVTGADPGFSAGGDLKMMKVAIESLSAPEGVADVWRWIRREFGGIARLIAGSDTIFVGALNGVGLAWALTCDLVIASDARRSCRHSAASVCSPRSAPVGRSPAASDTRGARLLPARRPHRCRYGASAGARPGGRRAWPTAVYGRRMVLAHRRIAAARGGDG